LELIQTNRNDTLRRAQDISNQIVARSLELNCLLRIANSDLDQVPPDPVSPDVPLAPPLASGSLPSENFSVGQRVDILNSYQGKQGQQGVVTCATCVQHTVYDPAKLVYICM